MYKVLDLLMSDDDFELLRDISYRYESGDITLKDFLSVASYLMKKYGRRTSDIWRYEYAIVKGYYEYVPQLIRAILRFRRPIRIPFDWKHYDYHWIQVTVFTIDPRWSRDDVEVVAEQIIDDLPENWNRAGGGVTFVPEYSIYDPPEVLTEPYFTERDYRWLKDYLDSYNYISRDPKNWHNYRPPITFKNSEHILSHYIVCGIEEDKRVVPEFDLLNALHVECPCEEGTDFPVSESLAVYAGTDISQYCILWKKGGWRVTGGKYIPPASGKPPTPRKPGRPPKYPKTKQETTLPFGKPVEKYPNPLEGYDVKKEFDKKFWDTLLLCQKYGMNPIPLQPDSKLPAIQWKYLESEPIKPEHLKYFKDPKYNIGIVAGYNNIVIVDEDFKLLLSVDTLTDSTPRGYHYYFRSDKPIEGVVFKITDGPYKGKSPLMIKSFGYAVAPYSTYKGKKYLWVRTDRLMRVRGESLIKAFKTFYERNYDKILKLFKPE